MTETVVPAKEAANRPTLPQIQIQNIDLPEIERAVYGRQHEEACKLFVAALQRLKMGAGFTTLPMTVEALKIGYTRMASAMVAMLADPNMGLGSEGFDIFGAEHAITDTMFRASAYGTSDFLLAILGNRLDAQQSGNNQPGFRAAAQQAVKFMVTHSLASALDLDHEQIFKQDPKSFFGLWCGMLAPLLVLTEAATARREKLLGLGYVFEGVAVRQLMLPSVSDAFMYASYATRPDKHKAKAAIIAAMRRGMLGAGVEEPKPEVIAARRLVRHHRPTILVCVEWFGGQHAMYRCYCLIIRQLRKRYRLVAMSRAIDIDEIGKAEFDEWHEVPAENLALGDLVKRVADIAPDMIYHPSLGMAMWWVALSSLRLAPIQFATLGHPASSMSPTMDYILCDEGAFGDPTLAVERIVTYPNGSARYVLRTDEDVPPPLPVSEVSADPINIAIPAMMCKVTVPFLKACKLVSEQAGRSVRWHFFINMLGLNLIAAAAELRAWLPDCLTYERNTYKGYMDALRHCHIVASTFPFGGTNSIIDSMMVGVPPVCIEGQEPHERFDAAIIRRAQLPDWLIANDVEGWIAAMVRLIKEDGTRNAIRDHLLTFDLKGEFYGPSEHGDAFARAVDLIFDNHEAIQALPDRAPIDSTMWSAPCSSS